MKALKIIGKVAAAYWMANATFNTIAYLGHTSKEALENGTLRTSKEVHDMIIGDFIEGCETLKDLIEYKLHK